jgi:hypothetical protein
MLDGAGVKVRAAEAAPALLGLEEEPPQWHGSDYRAALKARFNLMLL